MLLIAASYFFYACWDWRFLFLLIFSTSLDYFTGLKIYDSGDNKKLKKFWLLTSVIINLGFLGFFKYYNFFVESFAELMQAIGLQANIWTLRIMIPVGISFYTFHGLSYVLDIYNGKINPTKNVVDYSLFVSFFPLLVAGPIERATHLLPQLKKPRTFEYSRTVDGLKQILWGLFKKIVIADNCAPTVNQIFDNYDLMPANSLVLGAILFSFQIYGDFSGYSDIALGSARMLGIELLRNFSYPYFSSSYSEFWKRNHISMTTWFMDYVYYPMVGTSNKLWYWNLCMIITFLISGLWHGAGWNFIFWGFYQGVFIVISMNMMKSRKRFEKKYHLKNNAIYNYLCILITFSLVSFSSIFFRAESFTHGLSFIHHMFSQSWLSTYIGEYVIGGRSGLLRTLLLCFIFAVVEWRGKEHPYAIASLSRNRWVRYLLYYAIVFTIIIYGGDGQQFIYFQF